MPEAFQCTFEILITQKQRMALYLRKPSFERDLWWLCLSLSLAHNWNTVTCFRYSWLSCFDYAADSDSKSAWDLMSASWLWLTCIMRWNVEYPCSYFKVSDKYFISSPRFDFSFLQHLRQYTSWSDLLSTSSLHRKKIQHCDESLILSRRKL